MGGLQLSGLHGWVTVVRVAWVGCRWVEQAFSWNPTGVNRLAGSVAWLAGLSMQLAATQYVRRRWYHVGVQLHTAHNNALPCSSLYAVSL